MDGKFIRTFLKNRSSLKFKFVENVYFIMGRWRVFFSDICINTTLPIYYTQNRLELGGREENVQLFFLSIHPITNRREFQQQDRKIVKIYIRIQT